MNSTLPAKAKTPQNKRGKIIRVNSISSMMEIYLHDQALALAPWFDIVCVSSPGPEHCRMRKDGIKTKEIPITRPISPCKDIVTLWRLYRLFRHEKPDIVHTLTPKAGLLGMTAAWAAGVPIRIHTFTGLLFPWKRGRLQLILKATDRLTCLFATNVNPEGEGVRQLLQQHHITRKTLPVLGYGNIRGINLLKFSPNGTRLQTREKLGIPQHAFLFSFTGRLVGDKGINELVRSFLRLKEKNPEAALLLIGPEEPELDPLQPETRQAILQEPSIYAVGRRSDIPSLLEAADAFVFPSYREGFPNALLEAQAMGLPSIASDICGCNEIIIPGHTGLLIPSKDEKALLAAMRQVLAMSGIERKDMGRQARRRVEEKFSAESVNANLRQYYESLLD